MQGQVTALRVRQQLIWLMKFVKHVTTLIITCNEAGNLAGYGSVSNKFVIPKESNDVSLAMTSSYTGMRFSPVY